jgi:Family of unknown function (DUF6345)
LLASNYNSFEYPDCVARRRDAHYEEVVVQFSTGAVRDYFPCGVGPDLPLTIPEAANFRIWYAMAGDTVLSRWENGDVWGSDFRDGTDNDPGGGSDAPELYFYTGHGSCQNPPAATDPDFIVVCGNFGKPDVVDIGAASRWGNGHLKFCFLDARCPMDLVSLGRNWFPVFRGLHIATGNSGTGSSDTLDSVARGSQFAAFSSGGFFFFPYLSVGDAWMATGTIDVQSGCCAVAIAAGADRNDAIDRRENEHVHDNRPNPVPNWFAWKWVCR